MTISALASANSQYSPQENRQNISKGLTENPIQESKGLPKAEENKINTFKVAQAGVFQALDGGRGSGRVVEGGVITCAHVLFGLLGLTREKQIGPYEEINFLEDLSSRKPPLLEIISPLSYDDKLHSIDGVILIKNEYLDSEEFAQKDDKNRVRNLFTILRNQNVNVQGKITAPPAVDGKFQKFLESLYWQGVNGQGTIASLKGPGDSGSQLVDDKGNAYFTYAGKNGLLHTFYPNDKKANYVVFYNIETKTFTTKTFTAVKKSNFELYPSRVFKYTK